MSLYLGFDGVAIHGVHYWGSQFKPHSMAEETHNRVQRLIRLGEWLERNEAALTVAADVINEAHDLLVDLTLEHMPTSQ